MRTGSPSARVGGTARRSSGFTGSERTGNSFRYGRVLDVIQSPDHPQYKYYGGSQALYGVIFQDMFIAKEDDLEHRINDFAYCRFSSFRRLPIKNEVVLLERHVTSEWIEEDGVSHIIEKLYWVDVIPVWNNPNLNAYPDTLKYMGPADTGPDFKENGNIKPLQLAPGDLSLEGRYGNSIRLGGTRSNLIGIATSESNGKPYTIIRNGQGSSSGDVTSENIDKDDASIWLTSDHKVDLTDASTKRSAWTSKDVPVRFREYRGKQIVLNADKLVLNARQDSVQVAAKGAAGVTADIVGIDGRKYVALDALRIYLGTVAFNEKEPVLKGKTSTDWLEELLGKLDTFLEAVASPVADPSVWATAVSAAGTFLKNELQLLQSKLYTLHSIKVFTE